MVSFVCLSVCMFSDCLSDCRRVCLASGLSDFFRLYGMSVYLSVSDYRSGRYSVSLSASLAYCLSDYFSVYLFDYLCHCLTKHEAYCLLFVHVAVRLVGGLSV